MLAGHMENRCQAQGLVQRCHWDQSLYLVDQCAIDPRSHFPTGAAMDHPMRRADNLPLAVAAQPTHQVAQETASMQLSARHCS